MTFGEKLEHASKEDPKFARSVKRMRIASWVFGIGVALAIGIGVWSVAVNYQQGTQITKMESPCLRFGPKSEQCREAFDAAVATITHPQACAIQRKAGTLRAVRELAAELNVAFSEPCAGARIAQERQRSKERDATRMRSKGGDAKQPPSTGGQQPEPGVRPGGRGGVGPGRERSTRERPERREPPTPQPAPAPPPAPQPRAPVPQATPSSPLPPTASPKAEPPGLLDPALKGVGETVGKTQATVCSAADRLLDLC